jgi:rod shape-determining protein MreC
MLYGLMAIVLMAMDHRGHYVPKVRSLAEHAIEPLYHLVEWPNRALRNLYSQFQSNRTLRHHNDELQQQLLGQQAELQRLATLQEENRRLRALFEGAESLDFEYRFAELVRVDLDPFSHKVLIDRGSNDGVVPGQAVIDGTGVMGQVEDVHTHFSSVRLISDPNHALPVQINRTGLRSVAFGSGETNGLNLPNVPREADVRIGDLLVTSGLGDRFPGGYPVAEVTHIDREEGLTFAHVQARPLASLNRGREVLLIRAVAERTVDQIETVESDETPRADDLSQPEAGENAPGLQSETMPSGEEPGQSADEPATDSAGQLP